MSDELRLALAFAVALGATSLLTPLAIQLARSTNFLDRPVGYKGHRAPTPYLGGAAVMVGFLVAGIAFGAGLSRFGAIVACAVALWAVGTLDDRVGLNILPRFAVQVAVAVALWSTDFGWHLFGDTIWNLPVTVVWTVGLINAFNLMDNLDGATATVGGVAAAGAGLLAAGRGDPVLGAFAIALSGACFGFLRHNLARPARIFLGDGGSMPIGFLIAAVIMALPHHDFGWVTLLAAAPLAGLVIFDTTLVVVSRWRRGAPVLSGARDHLTHRLLVRLGSPQRVAAVLAAAQACLVGLAAMLYGLELESLIAAGAAYLVAAGAVLVLFETPLLAPEEAREPR